MEDVGHAVERFVEGTRTGEVRHNDEVEVGGVRRECFAEIRYLGFFPHAEPDVVACGEGLGDDMGAYEACCASDEDERLRHGKDNVALEVRACNEVLIVHILRFSVLLTRLHGVRC